MIRYYSTIAIWAIAHRTQEKSELYYVAMVGLLVIGFIIGYRGYP
jgi:hypothetical protein